MHRAHRVRLTLSFMAAGAMFGAVVLATDCPGRPRRCWVEVTHSHVSGQDSYLYDSWATGDEVWNAGVRRAVLRRRVRVAHAGPALHRRHLHGDATRRHRGPAEHVSNWLQGISGTSASDVWAVGYARYPGRHRRRPTIHHWNGSAWSIVPEPGRQRRALRRQRESRRTTCGRSATDGSFAPQTPIVLHWDGSTWTKMPFSIAGAARRTTTSVDIAADGKRPMVIGECRVGAGQPEPMVASYKQRRVDARGGPGSPPRRTPTSTRSRGSASRPGSAVAAGPAPSQPRLKKGTWTGRARARSTGPIFGIAGPAAKDLWAVGTGGTSSGSPCTGTASTWTLDRRRRRRRLVRDRRDHRRAARRGRPARSGRSRSSLIVALRRPRSTARGLTAVVRRRSAADHRQRDGARPGFEAELRARVGTQRVVVVGGDHHEPDPVPGGEDVVVRLHAEPQAVALAAHQRLARARSSRGSAGRSSRA